MARSAMEVAETFLLLMGQMLHNATAEDAAEEIGNHLRVRMLGINQLSSGCAPVIIDPAFLPKQFRAVGLVYVGMIYANLSFSSKLFTKRVVSGVLFHGSEPSPGRVG